MLLEAYRPYLLSIANQELPEELEGKLGPSDLAQETLVRGFEQFKTFHGTRAEELAAWLRQILLNHLLNTIRHYETGKRQVHREQSLQAGLADLRQPTPSGVALSQEEWSLLSAALERLPDHYREVILLRHREYLSFPEIGELLGKSEDAVRKLWLRALTQLRSEMITRGASSA